MCDNVHPGLLYYALWIAHPILQLGIAGLMMQRGLHRSFRFFFGYIVTQLVTFGIIFPTYWRDGEATFYLYWICQGVSVAFGFGVIHEVFVDVFRSFHTLRDLGTVLFRWAGLVMLLVAAVVSVSTNSSEIAPRMQAVITAQRCVRIIQVGMVLFLLFFAHYVGVSRRQRSFGIALGFGSFAMVELVLVASWVGNHLGNPSISMVNMAAYNVSLMVWFGYVAVKSPARESGATLLQTHRWEQSLADIQHPLPADSLIPMFEGMVDRALSRTKHVVPISSEREERPAAAAPSGFHLPAVRVGSKP